MADASGNGVDTATTSHETAKAAHVGARPKLEPGWWDGSVGAQLAYWRRRAETAEARCELLDRELGVLRGRT
jgi:hypothetical protein